MVPVPRDLRQTLLPRGKDTETWPASTQSSHWGGTAPPSLQVFSRIFGQHVLTAPSAFHCLGLAQPQAYSSGLKHCPPDTDIWDCPPALHSEAVGTAPVDLSCDLIIPPEAQI